MTYVTTKDGARIFYKDWGPKDAQPIVFHHGWPLSSDDWDAQMLFFLDKGYRVVANDRRGHGRSSQVGEGHDMDHYAADVAAVVEHLDLRDAVHVGHSTGGGEAARYVARLGKGRVAKLVLIGAVPPLMVKTPANPGGTPIEVFDDFRKQLAANRAGAERVDELVERVGLDALREAIDATLDYAERRTRAALARLENGERTATDVLGPIVAIRTFCSTVRPTRGRR